MSELDSRLLYLQEEGNALAESGDYKEAIQVFFKILELDPKIAFVHEAVSQLHSELDDDDAALQSAARAVSLAPEMLLASNDSERTEVMQELDEVNDLRSRALARELGLPSLKVLQNVAGKIQGSKILELGSGTGIVGITAALLGGHVILTDLPEVLPALNENIEANQQAIAEACGSAEAHALDWRDTMDSGNTAWDHRSLKEPSEVADDNMLSTSHHAESARSCHGKEVDLMLGADLVYSKQQVLPLVMALKSLREVSPSVAILLVHKHRSEVTDQALWEALRDHGFTIKELLRGSKKKQCQHPQSCNAESNNICSLNIGNGDTDKPSRAHTPSGIEGCCEAMKTRASSSITNGVAADVAVHGERHYSEFELNQHGVLCSRYSSSIAVYQL